MKYGFVHIWYDRKHKRFYIGCHWGSETDGYICSSSWMKRAYILRPEDFKRRILKAVHSNKQELYEEEYKWLLLIKDDELGKRYYNLRKKYFGDWSDNRSRAAKISATQKAKGYKPSDKCIKARLEKFKGKPLSEEHKKKLSIASKNVKMTWGHKCGRKGRKCPSENSIWINNGVINKRVTLEIYYEQYKEWNLGRTYHHSDETKHKIAFGITKFYQDKSILK